MNKKRLQALQCRDGRDELLKTVSTRRMPITDAQIRFVEPKDGSTATHIFEGYAVRWDSINTYGEKFARGAFADMIARFESGEKIIHMYYNHGWKNMFDARAAMRIGKYIDIVEDDIGLRVKGEFTPGLSLANDVSAMVKHETVDGLSIAFYPINDIDFEDMGDHIIIRRADLYEISPVDEPSDRNARLSRQSETINNLVDERDACDMLTKLGLNPDDARSFITKLDYIMGANPQSGDTTVPTGDDDPFAFLDNAS